MSACAKRGNGYALGRLPLLVAGLALIWALGCSKESKVARHLERGAEYVAAGDFLKAEIEYLNALRMDPANLVVSRQLGEVYYQQGNIPKAFALFKRAADSGAADDDLRLKLARIYLTGRKLKEARDEAAGVLRNAPESDAAWIVLSQAAISTNEMREVARQLEALRPKAEKSAGYHLAAGTLALRQQNLPAAEASFARALGIAPKFDIAHEMMATLYFRQKDVAKGGAALKMAAELASPRSVTPLRYADFLRDTGDEAGAMRLVEELVKKVPDYLPASVQWGQMLFTAKRNDECAEVTKRVLAMDPANYEALLLNGRLLLVKGEVDRGLEELEKLSRIHPRVPQVHYHLALAQLIKGDAVKSLASLAQAVNLDPDYVDALLLQADLNLRKGDTAAVVSSMTELVREKPQVGRAYVLLGDAHGARRNYAEALAVYGRMAQVFPKNPMAHQLTGGALMQQRKLSEARKAFEKARELAPDYYPAFEQLVGVDLAEKRYADALGRVQAEMQKLPKAAGPHLLAAQVYQAQTNLAQAEASLRKAMELEPESAQAPALLAQILAQAKRNPEALAMLRQALSKNPRNVGVLMQIGMLESAAGNYSAAREAYEQLLKVNPNFAAAMNNLAVLYMEQFNQLDQAYELARRARDLVPNDPILGDTLGWILFKRREYGWALGMLQQSWQKLPDEPEVAYHLGLTQYMMGDEEGARASLTQATAGTKTYKGREDAAQRLQLLNLDFAKADAATLARMEKHLADNPGDPVVSSRLAALEEAKGNFEKALGIYEKALAENKGNVVALSRAARIYAERLKNPAKALALAKAAREASPDDPVLAHTLGSVAYANGDQPWAVTLLEESNRKLPGDPEVLHDLALAQYGVGRVADAEATMQRALALGKAYPRQEAGKRWLTVSSLYKDPARLRQSAAALGEWLKVEPSSPAVLMATGALHELQNNAASAEQSYARLLALYPSFAPATIRLASLQAGKADTLPKAYEAATKLRQARPNDAEVARLLGLISYKRGDHGRAAQLLAESARTYTTDPEVWFTLGLAQHQLKQKDEARRALERLLAIESSGSRATEAKRILAELKPSQ